MTLEITQNGSVYENDTTVSGAPGVRISGTDVRFVNTSTGRVNSTLAGSPAISIEAAGAEIVNEAGGVINAFAAGDIAIQGGATDDMVQNAGTITGRVDLAGGADLFIRLAGIDGGVDLGIGNDIYRIDGGSDVADSVNGGLGTDRVELTGDLLSVDGGAMIGFEELRVGNQVLNVENFSNYLTVTIDPAGFTTFVDSNNPLASLSLDANVLIVGQGSVFNNVTGAAGTEDFEVNSGTILGSIDLAGGNDLFGYTWSDAVGVAPTLGGTVTGGAGTDRINFAVDGGQTIDVSRFTSFEEVDSGNRTSLVGDVRLINVDGYQLIQADGGGGVLRIADSDSSGARAVVGAGGHLILESTATIGLVSTALANASTGAANSAFSFVLTNNGTIQGAVELYLGNDIYDGRLGTEGGTIFGYAGNDSLFTGVGHDRIEGGVGDDHLSAGGGNDVVLGGTGDDILIGGIGIDSTDGGAGNDFHYVDHVTDAVVERIGEGGNDRVFAAGSYALTAGAEIEIFSTDFHAGTAAINLTGNALAQAIYGNAGENIIRGGGGGDTLTGFGGNDHYYVSDVRDLVVDPDGESASDRVSTSVSYTLAGDAEIETFSTDFNAGTAAINLTGNAFAQAIYGNAGANRIAGGGGGDTLFGFGGNDHYYVSDSRDLIFDPESESTADRVFAGTSYTLGAGVGIEIFSTDFHAGTAAINLTGNALAQAIYGNAGDNVITGGGGGDTLVGFGGNDHYHVSSASDVIFDSASESTADRVFTSTSYTLGAGVGIEIFSTNFHAGTAAIELAGNAFAQTIYGNAGNNVIRGGGGGDTLVGFGGNDHYYVSSAGDVIFDPESESAADRVFAGTSYTLGAGVGIEIFSTDHHAGVSAINLTGNALAQEIYGNAGANRINGGGGRDALNGFGGSDEFEFDTALNTAFSADFAALASTANVDQIADFGAGDEILLDDSVFAGLAVGALAAGAFAIGTTATDADDRILYDRDSGALMFDADGSGAAAAQMFAFVSPGLEDLGAGAFTVI